MLAFPSSCFASYPESYPVECAAAGREAMPPWPSRARAPWRIEIPRWPLATRPACRWIPYRFLPSVMGSGSCPARCARPSPGPRASWGQCSSPHAIGTGCCRRSTCAGTACRCACPWHRSAARRTLTRSRGAASPGRVPTRQQLAPSHRPSGTRTRRSGAAPASRPGGRQKSTFGRSSWGPGRQHSRWRQARAPSRPEIRRAAPSRLHYFAGAARHFTALCRSVGSPDSAAAAPPGRGRRRASAARPADGCRTGRA